eukprot:gene27684-36438_t
MVLAQAIPHGTNSLQSMMISGYSPAVDCLLPLIEAINSCLSRSSDQVYVSIGGLIQELSASPACRSLQKALPHLAESITMCGVALRRKVPDKRRKGDQAHESESIVIQIQVLPVKARASNGFIVAVYSPDEFVCLLALQLHAAPSQFVVLSVSGYSRKSLSPYFMAIEVSSTTSTADFELFQLHRHTCLAAQQVEGSDYSAGGATMAPTLTAQSIVDTLIYMAKSSHSIMNRLGLQQIRVAKSHDCANDFSGCKNNFQFVSEEISVRSDKFLRQGRLHSYLPACSPQSSVGKSLSNQGSREVDGDDDDCSFPRAILMKHIPLVAQYPTNTFATVGENHEKSVADFEQRITFEDFFPRERVRDSSSVEGDSNIPRDSAPDKDKEQQIDGIILEKNQRSGTTPSSSNSMYISVRNLYKRKELSGKVCAFWEGAFGHMKYLDTTSKVLRSALDVGDGVFHGVHIYQQMYSALFQRDCDAIHEIVKEYSGLESFALNLTKKNSNLVQKMKETNIQNYLLKLKNAPSCISHGVHLHSEIMGLKRKFNNLEAVATSYSELSAVEEYLLICGQVAYSGSEMYAALDMRQTLVNNAIATGGEGEPEFVKSGDGETESPCNELDDIARHGIPAKPSGYCER